MQLIDTLKVVSAGKKKSNTFILFSGVSVFLICIIYFSFFYHNTVDFETLKIDAPEIRSISPQKRVVGEVKLRKQTSLISRVSGVIDHIAIQDGQEIKENQLIATIYNPEIEQNYVTITNKISQLKNDSKLELAQRQLVLFEKRSQLEKAKLSLAFERQKYISILGLADNGLISSFELKADELEIKIIEQELFDLQQALILNEEILSLERINNQTKIKILEGELLLAKEKVDQLNIYSPLTGRVLNVNENMAIGAAVSSGELIANLYDKKDLDVRLRVPPSTAKIFSVGLNVKINIDAQQVLGKIDFIENKVSNGASHIWLKTNEPLVNMSSEGEQVTADVILPVKESVLTLLRTDWYTGAGKYQLYCYRSKQLESCEVELGESDENYIELVNNHSQIDGFEVSQNAHWLGKTAKVRQ